jgi:hypothetical protein
MKETRQRRKRGRHIVRWKAAITFARDLGRPVVHTQTQDLSVSGAAIFSDYGDLTGSTITLLLAPPVPGVKRTPAVLRVRARVVSTVRTPDMLNYRHGLIFIPSPNDGLAALDAALSGITVTMPEGALALPAAANRLEQLKQQAEIRLAQTKANTLATGTDAQISDALKRAYGYLKDLAAQLNVVKPGYPKRYAIAGVPEFNHLAWNDGYADFHTREITITTTLYERASMRFALTGKQPIHIEREYPASEKLQSMLTDCKIEFAAQEIRNGRGSIDRIAFDFPCRVDASVLLAGQFETGKILLYANNVSGFGAVQQVLAPEAISDASLDEFSGFILGETKALGPLLLRNA